MATYFIYIAYYYSLNESAERNNGKMYGKYCRSLELIAKVEGEFINAYDKMQEAGKSLINDGWHLSLNSRSKNYGCDSYIKVTEGEGWKDGHSAEIIYSTSELTLESR